MSYRAQRYLAVAVAMLLAGMGVLQVADPADFGLTPVAFRWLGVGAAMLGVLAGFLPSVRNMGTDPQFLVNRIAELPAPEQQAIASTLADRAERGAQQAPPTGDPTPWLPPERR